MAETTYASGDLRIAVRADKEDFLKVWEIISKAMESLEYPTFIDSFPVSPYYCARANEYRSTMIGFTAWGCEAYENNVKDLGKYLNGLSEWGLAEKDRRFLEGLDFALTYAFADYAEGDDSIIWMEMENVHKAGTPLSTIEYRAIGEKDHISATPENLSAYGIEKCKTLEDMQKSEKEEKKGKEQDGKSKQDSDVRQLKYDLLMAIHLKDEGGGRFGDHPVLLDLLSLGYFPKASEETFIIEYISDMKAGLV